MLVDPFDNSRWYYVHFLRQGWQDPEIQNLVLLFNGNSLIDVTGDFKKPLGFGGGVLNVTNGTNTDFDNLPKNEEPNRFCLKDGEDLTTANLCPDSNTVRLYLWWRDYRKSGSAADTA